VSERNLQNVNHWPNMFTSHWWNPWFQSIAYIIHSLFQGNKLSMKNPTLLGMIEVEAIQSMTWNFCRANWCHCLASLHINYIFHYLRLYFICSRLYFSTKKLDESQSFQRFDFILLLKLIRNNKVLFNVFKDCYIFC